ncbi:hypothetical protein QAD02_024181 [Eretmocerus hayati]|uniref:Uncharacterized protein n=1 Tax=Eretmocerus hayati TaxID=131215 RepID=A0ACC2PXX4_9HYME|nr:hypothetical protein QAD02_024181 [Eretmocerus hayati]
MSEKYCFHSWLAELECPQACISEHVVKTLHKGILGLLWEELPQVVRPFREVSEVKKNILLYKLKNETKDPLVQYIRKTCFLKDERKKLDAKIKSAEEQWAQQEMLCRKKAHSLEKKKIKTQALNVEKCILKTKCDQMLVQIKDCAKMKEICSHLMPPIEEEISQSTIIECLACIRNFSGGYDKKKVWNKISELLGPVKIPVLWNALLELRSRYTDSLIALDVEGNQNDLNSSDSNIDNGIAELCGQYLDNVARSLIFKERMQNYEVSTMSYLEKIDQIIEKQRVDLSDWVPLTLEVRKLEIMEKELKKEIETLEEQLPVDDIMYDDYLMQLVTDIRSMDDQILTCVQRIQNAFGLLGMSGSLITKTKEILKTESAKLHILGSSEKNQWLEIDLAAELSLFRYNIDTKALRKIILKGEIGAYKHLETCFSQSASMVDLQDISMSVSNFPMARTPLYYLVDLYKTFIANATLKKRICDEMENEHGEFLMETSDSSMPILPSLKGILELFRLTQVICKKTLDHSDEFDQILKSWSHQTVGGEILQILQDKTVFGASLTEWQTRYSMVTYVLQKTASSVS